MQPADGRDVAGPREPVESQALRNGEEVAATRILRQLWYSTSELEGAMAYLLTKC